MALTATAALPADLALAAAACSGASAAPRGPGPRPRLVERLVDALGDASSRRVPVRGGRTAGRARVALHATPRLPGDGASAAARCRRCLAAALCLGAEPRHARRPAAAHRDEARPLVVHRVARASAKAISITLCGDGAIDADLSRCSRPAAGARRCPRTRLVRRRGAAGCSDGCPGRRVLERGERAGSRARMALTATAALPADLLVL